MNNYIYLVRHGETEYNNKMIIHGQYDVPLNEFGIKQAKLLGVELKNVHFDLCICSPLIRAVNTAKEILRYHKNVPIIYDDRLKEIDLGNLENTDKYPVEYALQENLTFLKKHNVESHAHFYLRVKSLLDEITLKYKDKDVLLVSHCGTVRMSMLYFNPPDKFNTDEYFSMNIKNCSVQKFKNMYQDKQMKLITYDVSKEEWPKIAI